MGCHIEINSQSGYAANSRVVVLDAFRVSHCVGPNVYLVSLVDVGLPNTIEASQSPATVPLSL